jgi:hypothetical protein
MTKIEKMYIKLSKWYDEFITEILTAKDNKRERTNAAIYGYHSLKKINRKIDNELLFEDKESLKSLFLIEYVQVRLEASAYGGESKKFMIQTLRVLEVCGDYICERHEKIIGKYKK